MKKSWVPIRVNGSGKMSGNLGPRRWRTENENCPAIIDHFKTPLSQGLLSPLEIRKIFLNIEDLYATHLDFHDKLKLTMEQRFETRKISVPFKAQFVASLSHLLERTVLGLKWTVLGQSGRSVGAKPDGPNDCNWTVMYQSERSKRLKVDGEFKRGRSKR